MANIKNFFSIKDLENITGISTHSIRIWERRYQLLLPSRTTGNQRIYDINQLKTLLNIAFLKKAGYKISKISNLSEEEISTIAQQIVDKDAKSFYFISNMKIAMYEFDYQLFNQLYEEALRKQTFTEVFINIFIPYLHFLGLFWQTKTISTVHEHFISNLIYQKIQLHIAEIENLSPTISSPTFVLYLPEEEMHEIGILFLHYVLLSKGYRSIYLGRSVPVEDLPRLTSAFSNLYWIASFTIRPDSKKFKKYIDKVVKILTEQDQFWAVGRHLASISPQTLPSNLRIFGSLKDVLSEIK